LHSAPFPYLNKGRKVVVRHVKKLATILIAVMAIYVCQGTIFPPAAALAATGYQPFTTAENNPLVTATLNRSITYMPSTPSATSPVTGATYTSGDVFGGVTSARMAGGWGLPAMNALGTITMGGAAIYTAYQLGNYFRAKISGDTGATVTGANPSWGSYCGAGVTGDNGSTSGCTTSSSSWGAANFGGWGTSGSTGGVGVGFQVCSQGCWVLSMGSAGGYCTPSTLASCTGPFSGSAAVAAARASIIANSPADLINVDYNDTAGSTDCKAIAACTIIWRTWEQMREAVKIDTCTSTCYNSATTKVNNFIPTTTNGGLANNLQHAMEACGGFGSIVVTAQRVACTAAMNKTVDSTCDATSDCYTPGGTAGSTTVVVGGGTGGSTYTPFTIPRPDQGEDWQSYIKRLRDKGYLGTITLDNVVTGSWSTTADGRGIPDGSVVGVKVSTNPEVYEYDPTTGSLNTPLWPANPDQIPTSTTAVTVTTTPTGTFDPTAPTPGGGINFTPLTGISFGCKFPFGIFCYASDVTGWFNVTPVTPEFDFSIPGFTVSGTTLTAANDYNVSLSPVDTYMATLRSIFSVVLWVGASWFLASRLLGIQLGDPGAAIDEGLPL
jgi:hypothetical protein